MSLRGYFSRRISDETYQREVLGHTPVYAQRSTEEWEAVHEGVLSPLWNSFQSPSFLAMRPARTQQLDVPCVNPLLLLLGDRQEQSFHPQWEKLAVTVSYW